MKLFIHAGLHKTGTSSFQSICSQNRTRLARFGIHYPCVDQRIDHNTVMHKMQAKGPQSMTILLRKILEATPGNCNFVLLSGEDFENCIIDTESANAVEKCALEAGYHSIEWGIVYRDVSSYVASIYAQISQQSCILDYELLGRAALRTGYISVPTRAFDYLFALNYPKVAGRFHLGNRSFFEMPFEDFVNPSTGYALISHLIGENSANKFYQNIEISNPHINKRISEWDVELFYCINFLYRLGFRKRMGAGKRIALKFFLAPLLWWRIIRRRKAHRQLFSNAK